MKSFFHDIYLALFLARKTLSRSSKWTLGFIYYDTDIYESGCCIWYTGRFDRGRQ
jgi:hypothetical protein